MELYTSPETTFWFSCYIIEEFKLGLHNAKM